MTSDERKSFLRQFTLARRQVAQLRALYPECFDKRGRAIVATLRLPGQR